jgi:obg-like ATPase 1
MRSLVDTHVVCALLCVHALQVVAYEDFKSLSDGQKSMASVKAAGRYRQEGKQYIVADGDIIHFQFNVTSQKKK